MCLRRPPATTTTSDAAWPAMSPATSSSRSSERGRRRSTSRAPATRSGRRCIDRTSPEARCVGVAREGALARHEVLVHPDAARPRRGRSERECAVRVVDHDEFAWPDARDELGRLVEDEPVSGIRRLESAALDVGMPAQRAEVERHGPRLRGEVSLNAAPGAVWYPRAECGTQTGSSQQDGMRRHTHVAAAVGSCASDLVRRPRCPPGGSRSRPPSRCCRWGSRSRWLRTRAPVHRAGVAASADAARRRDADASSVAPDVAAPPISHESYTAATGPETLIAAGTNADWAKLVLIYGDWPVTEAERHRACCSGCARRTAPTTGGTATTR